MKLQVACQVMGSVLVLISLFEIFSYFIFSKFPFVNVKEVIRNYWKLLDGFSHRLTFIITPIILAVGSALIAPALKSTLEIFCTAIAIILGLLFAALGALAGFSPNTNSLTEEETYKLVFNETTIVIMYLAVLSVTDLFSILFGIIFGSSIIDLVSEPFVNISIFAGSVFVYGLTFSILINSLVVVKRISRLIKKK